MSRIGKKPVVIPSGVTAKLDGQTIAVKGAKGELKFTAPKEVAITIDGETVHVAPHGEDKRARAMWGTARAQVQNLIGGVTKGFEKKLEINGVGYKAAVAGKNLQLSLGYSHDIVFPIPAGVTIATPSRRRSPSPASTSGRSARSLRKSARSGAPNPIRAKG